MTDTALATFTEYFVRNYPGPDTVIFDPKWHAPKIFAAARRALSEGQAQQPVAYTSQPQLDRIEKEPGNNYVMWGEPLPYHNDIPLYLHPPVQEPVVKALETQEYTLRAMAQNYTGGHSWDHLDGEACTKAADEIRYLRRALSTTVGWKLVPTEATVDMVDAWEEAYAKAPEGSGHVWAWEDAYRAMLSASPEQGETGKAEADRLRRNLEKRDEYIIGQGLWADFVSKLEKPDAKA